MEIGSGAGRTTQTILSLVDNVKYVIADIPPALNLSYKNIKEMFPEKKISFAFNIKEKNEILKALDQNDIMYVFPHQIEDLQKNILIFQLQSIAYTKWKKKLWKNTFPILREYLIVYF